MVYDFSDFSALQETFLEVSRNYGDPKSYSNTFRDFEETVMGAQPEPYRLAMANVYTGKDGILKFLQVLFHRTAMFTQRQKFEYLQDKIISEMSQPTSKHKPMITLKELEHLLDKVQELFPFKQTVLAHVPLEITLIDAVNARCDSYPLNFYTGLIHGLKNFLCLYRLRRSSEESLTPELVFIQALGNYCREKFSEFDEDVPDGFKEFLKSILSDRKTFNCLSDDDIFRAFSEVFMMAVIYKEPEYAGPYESIPAHKLRKCYQYITRLFERSV